MYSGEECCRVGAYIVPLEELSVGSGVVVIGCGPSVVSLVSVRLCAVVWAVTNSEPSPCSLAVTCGVLRMASKWSLN
jgi:hypothetical protein